MTIGDDEVSQAIQADVVTQKTQVRRAAMASTIGTTIEWYDFFLYNTAAALVFPHLFFPESSAYAGAMQSFATYFVGSWVSPPPSSASCPGRRPSASLGLCCW